MSEKDILVEYMQKLKNMADFLARGYTLQSPYKENIIIGIVDNEMTTQRDAFSIQEHNTYDVLELSFKGEQKSIRTLMEYIKNGEYERQIEGKIDFNKPYIPEQYKAEFYQRVMKRVNVIYSSPYVMAVGTAKYLAHKLELETIITRELGERVLGAIGDKKIRMVSEMQENDFSYKLSGGESLNDVKRRMSCFINKIRRLEKDKTIAMFTHNVAITSYLSEYCTKGFNLDNRLILNYHDDARSEERRVGKECM